MILQRKAGRVIKPWLDGNGYGVVYVCFDGQRVAMNIHRLVAAAFHGPEPEKHVNHRDGDKSNNRPDNLEWVSRHQNMQHAAKAGLLPRSRRIFGTPYHGGPELEFPSASAAGRHFGILGFGMLQCAKGKFGLAAGYRWRFDGEPYPPLRPDFRPGRVKAHPPKQAA